MLDPRWIRDNLDEVRTLLANRNSDFNLDRLMELESKRRSVLNEVEELKAKRNEGSKRVGIAKKSGGDVDALMDEMRVLGDRVRELDTELSSIEEEFNAMLLMMPNRLHESVPIGKDETANVVASKWGEPRNFTFTPKPHWEIAEPLGIMDSERGVKIAESRFTVLKGAGAKMERALINFMVDLHTTQHGYTEIMPPYMVNSATMTGTGQLPKFADESYKCANDDLWLIPTSEVPLTNLHSGEMLDESDLPIHYTAYSACFRREAGSYGRDMRGMLRQHQFDKVELVKICTPETGYEELDKLTADAEKILQLLELPYRVMILSSGDIGNAATKTYDLEVWMPSQNCYREISSCSNCGEFQARRANIRYRSKENGKPKFAHTLNGSGIAVGRCFIAIIENYQNEDGSITIPTALRPYMGGMEVISCPK